MHTDILERTINSHWTSCSSVPRSLALYAHHSRTRNSNSEPQCYTGRSEWNVISETKKNTFLSGFSKIGGLWTFLSGIFAAVFGSSLIHILFGMSILNLRSLEVLMATLAGTQPISVFGLAHRWKRGPIKKAYRTEYPAILDEMSVPQHSTLMLITRLRAHWQSYC